jgi:hypothetical protein
MHYASEFWSLSADAGQERKKAGGGVSATP